MKESLSFSVIGLQHDHIYSMCRSLMDAGAVLRFAFDKDPLSLGRFLKAFPNAEAARCELEVLEDGETRLVAGAAVTCERAALGIRVLESGKDYFTDKGPFTKMEQLDAVKRAVERTGKKYMVCYSERLQSECSVYAGMLIQEGKIGKVVSVTGLGPHRLNADSRPAWFFQKEQYGGILCDIGSHQFEQFLSFSGAEDAQVLSARAVNFAHPEWPDLEDYGDAHLVAANGVAGYLRVDWFTPDGLSSWGDVRTVITGTEGSIELRKNCDVASARPGGDHLYLVTKRGETYIDAKGKAGFPFFRRLIDDCLERTETAMTQAHVFKAAQLCLTAQQIADSNRMRERDFVH